MPLTAGDATGLPRDAAGCGLDLALSFPFLAAPPPAVLRGEASFGETLFGGAPGAPHAALAEALLRHVPAAVPTRIHVGSETCERLLPSPRSLVSWVDAVRASGWGVSLVLPPLGREGQALAQESVGVLHAAAGAEVVANDWGTVHRLRVRFPDLPIALGRLMHKMVRDPRVADRFDSPQAPMAARSALCRSGELAPGFRALMERYGIGRREIDPYLQPLEEDEWDQRPERLTVHFPYQFVTMGRSCLLGGMHREREEMFVPGAACRAECRRYAVEFRLPVPDGNGAGRHLLNLGNAYYHAVPPHVVERVLSLLPLRRRVDRIVVTVPADGHGWTGVETGARR